MAPLHRLVVTCGVTALLLTGGCALDPAQGTPADTTTGPDTAGAAVTLLDRVAAAGPDESFVHDGVTVTAGAAYHAASGHACRPLVLRSAESNHARLACQGEHGWFMATDVYAGRDRDD